MQEKEVVYQELVREIPKEKIKRDEPMNQHTSFKIGGKADIFVEATKIEEIKWCLEIAKQKDIPIFILGNGTNILVKDEGFRGIILKVRLEQIEIQKESEKVKVTVGAGVKLALLAKKLWQESITGFEFASGIPGTIGGAIRMNAGAHGKEMKDIVQTTTYMDWEGNIYTRQKVEQKFDYRTSVFCKEKSIILETVLELQIGEKEKIQKEMDEYAKFRKEKQPIQYPSAGSTFKRGEDFITAKLIDEAGLKGFQIGGAQVSLLHAGFVINTGNATASEVLELIQKIKDTIKSKFNKTIELEIEIVG